MLVFSFLRNFTLTGIGVIIRGEEGAGASLDLLASAALLTSPARSMASRGRYRHSAGVNSSASIVMEDLLSSK